MDIKDHCKRSLETFGKEYLEVHKWLDEHSDPRTNPLPRRHRHHLQALKELEELQGKEAVMVARQHIIDDFQGFLSDVPDKWDYHADFWEQYQHYLEQKEDKQPNS